MDLVVPAESALDPVCQMGVPVEWCNVDAKEPNYTNDVRDQPLIVHQDRRK